MNKNIMGQIHNPWPIYIGEFIFEEHSLIKEELITFLKNYEKKIPEGNQDKKVSKEGVINKNCYMSKFNLLSENQNNQTLKKLFHFIAKSILETAKAANKNIIQNMEEKNPKFDVNIQETWFIRYNKEGLVFPHTHGGSWCCVYYLQIGEDAAKKNGSTFFLRPYTGGTKEDFGGKYLTHDTVIIDPKEGKLLVWPNYVYHGSHPYEGDQDKIIISANSTVDNLKN
jgi:uncharacterized protein (TIGR02466 family)